MDNTLKQYLDLYENHKELLNNKSAEGFNPLRVAAYNNLQVTGLPEHGTEDYEIINVPEMLAPDYGLNIGRIPLDVNLGQGFKCGIPQLSSSLFFMLNDMWAESKGARNLLPDGIEIGPLSQYLAKDGEGLKDYGKIACLENPLVALNTLFVQEGLYIRVKRGVKVEKPIQLVSLLEGMIPMMAVRRLLIILEPESELRLILCSHTSSSHGQPMVSLSVAEILVEKHSKLELYDLEESSSESNRLSSIYLKQEACSDVLIESFTLHNGKTRNEYHCTFEGEEANLHLSGVGIEGGENILDNYSHISHKVGGCHTAELFKYIVDDKAKGSFVGRIFVAPGAIKTEAYQSNRNLVGSVNSKMFSKPQLEIYNDDVKCSHGSATGQLDAMQLFYLRSRGLNESEAKLLLKQAFMADIIEEVRVPILRDRLHSLIEKRLAGTDTTCGECDICNV